MTKSCYHSSVTACYRLKRKLAKERCSLTSRLERIERKRVARVPELFEMLMEVDAIGLQIDNLDDLHGPAEENIYYTLTAPGEGDEPATG